MSATVIVSENNHPGIKVYQSHHEGLAGGMHIPLEVAYCSSSSLPGFANYLAIGRLRLLLCHQL